MHSLKKGGAETTPWSSAPKQKGETLVEDSSTEVLQSQYPYSEQSPPLLPLPSKGSERVQPASVQASCPTDSLEREDLVSMGAIADPSERAVITLTIEIDTSICAAADLEKLLVRPGRSIWLRHYLGEAIRYVVGKDRGRQWYYRVTAGRITWKALQ